MYDTTNHINSVFLSLKYYFKHKNRQLVWMILHLVEKWMSQFLMCAFHFQKAILLKHLSCSFASQWDITILGCIILWLLWDITRNYYYKRKCVCACMCGRGVRRLADHFCQEEIDFMDIRFLCCFHHIQKVSVVEDMFDLMQKITSDLTVFALYGTWFWVNVLLDFKHVLPWTYLLQPELAYMHQSFAITNW